jgi:hypothetical protein
MHRRYSARLDGASVTLHENGNHKMLANYPEGKTGGPCRVWDDEKHMLLYSQYKDGKKHGVTCLLKDGVPWLVQEWDKGTLQNETVVAKKGNEYVAVDDAQQLAESQKRLSAVEKQVAETESDLNKSLRKWFTDEGDRFKKEKGQILKKVADAQGIVRRQQIRQEEARRQKGIHTHRDGSLDRNGHAALEEERSATRDLKEARKNLEAITREAKLEMNQMEQENTKHYKELYRFALAALGESLPDAHVLAPDKHVLPPSQDAGHHKKKRQPKQ